MRYRAPRVFSPWFKRPKPFAKREPVPFAVPESARMEHTSILGGSGAGKTTLLQQIILDDLASPDPPGMVVIDPKGHLAQRLQKLAVFHPETGRLKDRIVIVDPDDDPPPALNMFHPADKWNRMYSDNVRHQVESQAISNFAYIFSSIESTLTQKQAVCFTFCVRLLFRHDGATIHTLMELLNDPAKTSHHSAFSLTIERLDETSRRFFLHDYYTSAFGETRQQIKARLYGILVHPRLVAMFSTPERKLDMFDCLQKKKIVLVKAALGAPGSDASQLFARYFVALTLNAAFERVGIKDRSQWHPAHLIVDEFQLVADELKTPEMLRLAREYNLGITMAFQEIHGRPFNDGLRASISTNTSVKYASSPEGVDIAYAARDLRCEQDFIRAQTKTATHGRFGCFVRGWLDHAVSLTVPFGNIEREPQMDAEAYERLLVLNRERLSLAPTPPRPTRTPPAATSPSTDDKPRTRRW